MKYTKEYIADLLARNSEAVERAICRLYERQTASEQSSATTEEDNGVGFSGCHAGIASSFAVQILTSDYPAGRRLSPKQLPIARRIVLRYTRQLVEIANGG